MNRDEFIENLDKALNIIVSNKSLEPYFFNWADADDEGKKDAEDTLNSLIPGKWRFVHLWGNGTNVGEGWFAEDNYNVYISLACYDDYEEAIDTFDIYKKEEIDYQNIENKKI